MADQPANQKTNIPEGAKTVPPKGKTSGNKTVLIIAIVVIVLFVLPGIALAVFFGWLASGDNAEKLTEDIISSSTGNSVDINTDDGTFKIETDEGSISVGEQKIPEDFPSVVVLFDNQKVTGVVTNTQDGSSFWSVNAETNDSADTVNAFVVSKYEENSWTTASKSTFNSATTYTFEKDDLQTIVTVTSNPEPATTNITYYVSKEPQQ
jgi:hypothetical protein